MPLAQKHPKPANDRHLQSSQRMSYVSLARPRAKIRKAWAVVGVTSLVALLIGFVSLSYAPKEKPAKSHAPLIVAKPPEPFDIKINASALAPDSAIAAIEPNLPAHVLDPKQSPASVNATFEEPPQQQPVADIAASQAQAAQQFLKQGDVKQALRSQHRAATLAPDNTLYRLDLAILYDRLGHSKNAAMLYQQLIQAYEAHDKTLPVTLDIKEIQQRLTYLTQGEADADP